jgi:hypothetical protein
MPGMGTSFSRSNKNRGILNKKLFLAKKTQ